MQLQINWRIFGFRVQNGQRNLLEWPENIVLKPSKESRDEAKLIKEVLMKTMEKPKEDELWTLMEKFSYWKAIRITVWENEFL